jgi:hypothetical protein
MLAALFAFSLPIALYGLGLFNIESRPEPPTLANNVAIDTAFLQQAFRSQAPIAVHVVNPWTYLAILVNDDSDLRLDNGALAVWFIARNYNSNHLRNCGRLFWHLSGAA